MSKTEGKGGRGNARALVAAAACCAAVAVFAAPAQAGAVKAIWGPDEFPAGSLACADRSVPCSAFPVYRELGVDVYQFQIHWDDVAPTRPRNPRNPDDPAYEWGEIAKVVEGAARYGIRPAALVQRTPSWANNGRPPIWAPRDPRAFADFLVAASRRFPEIRIWMIWGEPARLENFRPMRRGSRVGPRHYARLVDTAYGALKRVHRNNTVIGGMTLNGGTIKPPLFLRWMKLPNGRPPRMDLWGHNPFDARFPDLSDRPIRGFRGLNDIDTLFRQIRTVYRRGHRRVPRLWLAEWTIVSDQPSYVFGGVFVSPKEQARRLRAAYRLVRRARYAVGLGWFTLMDQPRGLNNAYWGLMRANGRRKPSFRAYKRVP